MKKTAIVAIGFIVLPWCGAFFGAWLVVGSQIFNYPF